MYRQFWINAHIEILIKFLKENSKIINNNWVKKQKPDNWLEYWNARLFLRKMLKYLNKNFKNIGENLNTIFCYG